jgi:hypothetical protein
MDRPLIGTWMRLLDEAIGEHVSPERSPTGSETAACILRHVGSTGAGEVWRRVCAGDDVSPMIDPAAVGPLLPALRDQGIEVWHGAELAALHALSWNARWAARCDAAAAWMLDEVQPDNATNRPWAIHWFVRMAAMDGGTEAEMYAQTLLHNARISDGAADELGLCLLRDSLSRLRSM